MDPVAVGSTAASLATESIELLKSALDVVPADGGRQPSRAVPANGPSAPALSLAGDRAPCRHRLRGLGA